MKRVAVAVLLLALLGASAFGERGQQAPTRGFAGHFALAPDSAMKWIAYVQKGGAMAGSTGAEQASAKGTLDVASDLAYLLVLTPGEFGAMGRLNPRRDGSAAIAMQDRGNGSFVNAGSVELLDDGGLLLTMGADPGVVLRFERR